jgi:glutathione peroxidase
MLGAEFPITGKVECWKDADTHPLYSYLTSSIPDADGTPSKFFTVVDVVPLLKCFLLDLKWNFAKFLCDADGTPVKRYSPKQSPLSFEADIVALLN